MLKKIIKIFLVCAILCGCHPASYYRGKVYIQNKEYKFKANESDEELQVFTYDVKTKNDQVKIKTIKYCGEALTYLENEDIELVSRKDYHVGLLQIQLIPRAGHSELEELTFKVNKTPTTIKVKLGWPVTGNMDEPYDEWYKRYEFILNVTE